MEFDYSELRGLIISKYRTQEKFALALGIDSGRLSIKLNRTGFSATQIVQISKLLEIASEDIGRYFFTPKVQITKQEVEQ